MKLVLLCHGATASMRTGGFPARDEPLDEGGLRKLADRAPPRFDRIVAGPDAAARRTAEALTRSPTIAMPLRDIDHGGWAGRSFVEVRAADAAGLAAWLATPWVGTPGGESFAAVCARASTWLDGATESGESLLVVVPPMIVRALLSATIGLSPEAAMRIDVAPLTAATLSRHGNWRLQRLGEPLFG